MDKDFVGMVAAAADVKKLGRIGKAAVGRVFSDLVARGMSERMAAGVFMATVMAVYCYIADASFVPGDDVDARVWEEFKTRVDRCAARSAAARLRWERIRARRAEVAEVAVMSQMGLMGVKDEATEKPEKPEREVETEVADGDVEVAVDIEMPEAEVADGEIVVPEEMYEDVVGKVAYGLPFLDESRRVDCRCMSVEVIAYDWYYERGLRDGRLMRAVEEFIEEVARRYRVRMGW